MCEIGALLFYSVCVPSSRSCSISLFMLYVCLCSFSSYFMCVRFVIQTIGREMILHERKRKSTPNGECGKNLLRESRLTWKNSSRNIWIEICVNGCECECDVLNQRKLQLVQSLKSYSSRYVPVRAHNYSMQHSIQPSSQLVAFYAYKTRSLSLYRCFSLLFAAILIYFLIAMLHE